MRGIPILDETIRNKTCPPNQAGAGRCSLAAWQDWSGSRQLGRGGPAAAVRREIAGRDVEKTIRRELRAEG